MFDKNLWNALNPGSHSYDSFGERAESLESYIKKVSDLGLNIPTDVIEQWIYRHYEYIDARYISLGIEKMKFEREIWDSNKVYSKINTFEFDKLGGMGHNVYEEENWLISFMLKNRTWPKPIIVLENNTFPSWGTPYHLLEGHQRLDFFREIYQEERDTLKDQHEIWVVKLIK
ncbi:hypothetical protein J2W97_001230 [Paenibacillus jamilae]|uniref:hypothetical protein n=1 Tax=Paenibacillus sp. MZ03-122A TaxID=2962033 RepID=UPI0020B82EC5|nr:hypothetical protein [Paenibacillus sp. MZ03-122A]MCP3777050.1 hypothetical protein [Paenibacillus sp. MZ03-122A]MDP9675247.1 hypothetical protein [Paenibacillus jamilae]